MRIGLIGYGTIGLFLANQIRQSNQLELAFVVDPALDLSTCTDVPVYSTIKEANLQDVQLLVEAANAQVLVSVIEQAVAECDVLGFSVTAFSNQAFHDRAVRLCQSSGHHIFVPHGAILGLDGVLDGNALWEEVRITTIKTPKGLGSAVTERTVLFDGTAREACAKFPKNVNVHAALSLAGIGFDKTKSVIVADPAIPGNTHMICFSGEGVKFEIKIESVPKGLVTGAYTPYSAFGSLLRIVGREAALSIV